MGRKKVFNNVFISNTAKTLTESVKAEVVKKEIRFPKDLGEEHLFDLKLAEATVKKVGLVNAIVDKHVDFIISPGFYVTSNVKKAETLINNFIRDGFDQILRTWVKEGLTKGNSYIEPAFKNNEFRYKVLNSNYVYKKRNKKGELLEYNQYFGSTQEFNPNKVIQFEPDELIELPISTFADDAYGVGIVFPLLKTVDYLSSSDADLHMLMRRKANAPIHAKLGTPEEPVSSADVAQAGTTLEYLNNMHEWATDHRWEFKVVDFGNIGEKFAMVMESDKETLFMAAQVPMALMGKGNLPEGLAQVQSETWERRVESLQGAIEKVVEEKIFQPILETNGIKARIEMEWGQPSESKLNARLEKLSALLSNPTISPQLRAMLEIEIATLLQFNDKWIKTLTQPQMLPEIERDEEGNIVQPEIPGEKPQAAEAIKKLKEDIKWHIHEGINEEDNNLKLSEWINFDYLKYKQEVLKFIREDNFSLLQGNTKLDFALGKLNKNQIEQLREVLLNNFENNGTIYQIAEDIKKLGFKSVYTINNKGEKKLILDKSIRPMAIARSESTRVAAEGLLENYRSKDIKEVRFLASISQRTCPICESLNGNIFSINEAQGLLPIHVNCRCSFIAVTNS